MKKVAIESIRIDGGTQMRERINTDAVDDYAEAYEAGAKMPPLDVFFDGKEHWLANGFHRYHGVRKLGWTEIDCIVHKGTRRDAVLFAASSNETNGLRRTRPDKRTAVTVLLHDPEWSQRSDSWISEAAKVSPYLVRECRKQVSVDVPGYKSTTSAKTTEKKKGKDGKSYPAKSKARKKVDLHVPPIDEAPKPKPSPVVERTEEEWEAFHVREHCMELRQMVRDLMEMRDRLDGIEFVRSKAGRLINEASNIIAEDIQSAEEAA